jgi:hypothetical protein
MLQTWVTVRCRCRHVCVCVLLVIWRSNIPLPAAIPQQMLCTSATQHCLYVQCTCTAPHHFTPRIHQVPPDNSLPHIATCRSQLWTSLLPP